MTSITVYDDPKKFWTDVSPQLKKDMARNSLVLGLSYTFQTNPEGCLYQSALFENNRVLSVLVCSRYRTNHNLLPTSISAPVQAKELFEMFQSTSIPVTGIVGENDVANEYARLLNEIGRKTKVNMRQGIYRCTKVILPQTSRDIFFRKAELKDVQQIGEWIESFHLEAVPHDPPVNGVEFAKAKIENGMIYVVEKHSKLVSMAGWGRDIETSCSINLVFTPKHLRGNGYASSVTAELTQFLLDSGKQETNLYTDMSNPTSNKIYQNIGYEFVCDSIHIGVS